MSLPLSRRIAQAALLVAAGATPLLAAGSASALDLVPQGDLASGITQADAPDPAATVQGATHELGQSTGATAASTVATGVPATADATGHTVAAALPDANHALGKLTAPAAKTAATTGTLATIATTVAPKLLDRAGPALTSKLAPIPGGTQRSASATNALGGLTGALPTAGLTHALPTGPLSSGLPTSGVTKALPGADALGALTGAHDDTHRLGGLPGLGAGSGTGTPLDAVTHLLGGALPLPGVGG